MLLDNMPLIGRTMRSDKRLTYALADRHDLPFAGVILSTKLSRYLELDKKRIFSVVFKNSVITKVP